MVDRRGFLWTLLAAPFVGRAATRVTTADLWSSIDGAQPQHVGKFKSIIYNDRMWFTSREGVHVYYSDVPDPE